MIKILLRRGERERAFRWRLEQIKRPRSTAGSSRRDASKPSVSCVLDMHLRAISGVYEVGRDVAVLSPISALGLDCVLREWKERSFLATCVCTSEGI